MTGLIGLILAVAGGWILLTHKHMQENVKLACIGVIILGAMALVAWLGGKAP